jgi:hypothetical protein
VMASQSPPGAGARGTRLRKEREGTGHRHGLTMSAKSKAWATRPSVGAGATIEIQRGAYVALEAFAGEGARATRVPHDLPQLCHRYFKLELALGVGIIHTAHDHRLSQLSHGAGFDGKLAKNRARHLGLLVRHGKVADFRAYR